MEDIVQLVIFLAVIFFGLLMGGSKKKRQQQQRRTQRPPATPVREPTPAARAPERQPTRQSFAQEIMDLLQAQLPEPEVEKPGLPSVLPERQPREAVSLEVIEEEARSLETLEAAGGRSHRVFHERYMDGPESTPKESRPSRFRRINPQTARDAVIWRTIFSPPKGLE